MIEQRQCSKCGEMRAPRRCANCKHVYDQLRYPAIAEKKQAVNKVWRENNLERDAAMKRAYSKAHPEIAKKSSRAFHDRNPDAARASRERGKARNGEKLKARYEANREKRNEANRAWKRAHPESAREHNRRRRLLKLGVTGSHTKSEWDAIVRKQRNKCAHCEQRGGLTRDHVIPLHKGGSDFAFNIQGLCRPCNSRKRAKLEDYAHFSLFDRKVA